MWRGEVFAISDCLVISPPEGVARYCFHPVCVCVCVCVCVSVCPANILIFYFSATRTDIDLKLIQDTYRLVLDSLKNSKKLTFIGQLSRSQGRYIAYWSEQRNDVTKNTSIFDLTCKIPIPKLLILIKLSIKI